MTEFPYKGLGEREWQFISLATSFPPIITLTLAVIALSVTPTLTGALYAAGVYWAIFVAFPTLIILGFLHIGWVSDIELRDRHERDRVYPVMIIISFLGLFALRALQMPDPILLLGVIQTVLVTIVFFINKSWKISVHTTSWGACLTALLMVVGWPALLLLPVAVPMTYSRFALDCHTRDQVIAGYVVGFLISLLVFFR